MWSNKTTNPIGLLRTSKGAENIGVSSGGKLDNYVSRMPKDLKIYGIDLTGIDQTAEFSSVFNSGEKIEYHAGDLLKVAAFKKGTSTIPVGGDYEPKLWVNEVLPWKDYIVRGNLKIDSKLPEPIKGIFAGNSIQQGTGTSTTGYILYNQIQFKLRDYFNKGIYEDWVSINAGIGGDVLPCVTQLTARNKNGNAYADQYDYIVILCMRNDIGDTQFEENLGIAVENAKASGLDVIIISDPPKIDLGTGDINEPPEHSGNYSSLKRISNIYGCSIVDCWQYFYDCKTKLGIDLRGWMSDEVHPNDSGYLIIGNMLFDLMVRSAVSGSLVKIPIESSDPSKRITASYDAGEPVGGTYTALADTTGGTQKTIRKIVRGESTVKSYKVTAGNNIKFSAPVGVKGVALEMENCSGTFNIKVGGVNLAQNVTATAVPPVPKSFKYRQYSFYSQYMTDREITIECVSGEINITMLTVESGAWIHDAEPIGVYEKTSTAVNTTLFDGSNGVELDGNNEQIEFIANASEILLKYGTGNNYGIIEIYTDDILQETIDCYASVVEGFDKKYIAFEDDKIKRIKIKVTGKNASSSGYKAKIGKISLYAISQLNQYIVNKGAGEIVIAKKVDNVNLLAGNPALLSANNGRLYSDTPVIMVVDKT